MHVRRFCRALDHEDVRELLDAEHFADKRGKRLNTSITIHPKLLAEYPADVGQWLSSLLNKLRIWCCRAGFGYFGIWVRESYEGDRREHVHMLLYVPVQQRGALEAALRRWLPGRDEVVHLREPGSKTDRFGHRVKEALPYMLKQMTPQAWFALHKRVRREKQCRETHAPVAAVLGKRCGVSRTLNKATQEAFWTRRAGEKPRSAAPQERRHASGVSRRCNRTG